MTENRVRNKNNLINEVLVRKKMNKSLLVELLFIFVPIVVAIFGGFISVLFTTPDGNYHMHTVLGFIFSSIGMFIIFFLIFLIIKLAVTLTSMNYCMKYFMVCNDEKYLNKCSISRLCYLISYVLLFIPVIRFTIIFILIFNLVIWFDVKRRLKAEEQYKKDFLIDSNKTKKAPNSNRLGYLVRMLFALIGFIVVIALTYINIRPYLFDKTSYEEELYRDVIREVDPIKKQVELCIKDLGIKNFIPFKPKQINTNINSKGCSNTSINSGNGWYLNSAPSYKTKYIDNIKINVNGVITVKVVDRLWENGSTYQWVPYNGRKKSEIYWRQNDVGSDCVRIGVC